MDNLEQLPEMKNNEKFPRLITGAEFLGLFNNPDFRKKWEERNQVKCPKCNQSYNWQTIANEPFRAIVEDSSNTMKVCRDCYWKWVYEDPIRYFSRIEETDEGFCYVKELGEDEER
jgi:hypothetical protein